MHNIITLACAMAILLVACESPPPPKKKITPEIREAHVEGMLFPIVADIMEASRGGRIGIWGFYKEKYPDQKAAVSDYLAPLMTNQFVQSRARVISRSDLDKILDEQVLTREDIFDPRKVKEIGLLESIDVMVIGEVKDLSLEKYSIIFKLLDVETGEIILTRKKNLHRKYLPIEYGGI